MAFTRCVPDYARKAMKRTPADAGRVVGKFDVDLYLFPKFRQRMNRGDSVAADKDPKPAKVFYVPRQMFATGRSAPDEATQTDTVPLGLAPVH